MSKKDQAEIVIFKRFYQEIIQIYSDNYFVILDPPYPIESKKKNNKKNFRFPSKESQEGLKKSVKSPNSSLLPSTPPPPIIRGNSNSNIIVSYTLCQYPTSLLLSQLFCE